jgi:hypothetical protein
MLPLILSQTLIAQGYLELQMDRPGAKKIIRQYERPTQPTAAPTRRSPSFQQRTNTQEANEVVEQQLPSNPIQLDFLTNPIIPQGSSGPVIVKNNSPYNVSNVIIHHQTQSGDRRQVRCGSYLRRGETCEMTLSGPTTVQMIQGTPAR